MGKLLATAAALALLSSSALAAPMCPAGLNFPFCEVGVAVFEGAEGPTGCFWVTINSHVYAVIPPATPAQAPGFQSLKDGLNMGKGQMHVFTSTGAPVTSACALPNRVVLPLGDIQ